MRCVTGLHVGKQAGWWKAPAATGPQVAPAKIKARWGRRFLWYSLGMLETLAILGLIGGAGYVGYRMCKGGSKIQLNPVDVQAVRRKAANQDLKLVRKEGEIAIADTREGTVWLRYESGNYSLTKAGLFGGVLASGELRVVKPVLESLYDVVVEPS